MQVEPNRRCAWCAGMQDLVAMLVCETITPNMQRSDTIDNVTEQYSKDKEGMTR